MRICPTIRKVRRVHSSSYGDTKSTEQLAKSSGSNASKGNAHRGIETELRVRIGGDLMVDLIEIAKPLTRLKSIRQNQEPAGALSGARKTCIEPMRDEFRCKMPGIPEMLQESSRAAACYRLSPFRRDGRNLGKGLAHFSFLSLSRTRLHQSPAVVRSRTRR